MKKVIASSMVHLVCMVNKGDHIQYLDLNLDVDKALTPEEYNRIKRVIAKKVGSDDVIILNWQRYEM